MIMTPLSFFYGLNVISYLYDASLLLYDEKLSTKQKIFGIVPRALGIVVDSSLLAKGSTSFLTKTSSAITATLPAADALAYDSSYVDAGLALVANASRLGSDRLPKGAALLISSAAEKKPLFVQGCKTTANLYKTHKNNIKTSLPDTESYRKRIQEKKEQFLTDLKIQENNLQQVIQNYYDILNNVSADNFGSIPYYYMNRPEFQKRTCRISLKTIREAIVIRKTKTSPPIYYECDDLSGWFKLYRERNSPPSWPKSIPFNRDAITIDKAETSQITESLQKALDKTLSSPKELEEIKIAIIALQEIEKDLATKKT